MLFDPLSNSACRRFRALGERPPDPLPEFGVPSSAAIGPAAKISGCSSRFLQAELAQNSILNIAAWQNNAGRREGEKGRKGEREKVCPIQHLPFFLSPLLPFLDHRRERCS